MKVLEWDPTTDQVSCKMKSMEQVIASEIVYELYQSGDHTSVVMRLRPMLEWKSDDNYSMVCFEYDKLYNIH